MKYGKLRIAWLVTWAVLAVFLCVLWVRSYWKCDSISLTDQGRFFPTLGSNSGTVYFVRSVIPVFLSPDSPVYTRRWNYNSSDASEPPHSLKLKWVGNQFWDLGIYVPYGLIVSAVGVLAAAPRFTKVGRYSLRTMLVAMSLIATGLGLIVWMGRVG